MIHKKIPESKYFILKKIGKIFIPIESKYLTSAFKFISFQTSQCALHSCIYIYIFTYHIIKHIIYNYTHLLLNFCINHTYSIYTLLNFVHASLKTAFKFSSRAKNIRYRWKQSLPAFHRVTAVRWGDRERPIC